MADFVFKALFFVVEVFFLVVARVIFDMCFNCLCNCFYNNVVAPCCRCCCPCCCKDRNETIASTNPVHNMENAAVMQNYTVVVLEQMPQPAPGYAAQQPQMLQSAQREHQLPANSLTAKWPGASPGGADRATRIASFR
jgi:hypothetical protein